MQRTPNNFARQYQRRLAVWAAVWMLTDFSGVAGETSRPTEYQVKAAYISNFGKFVQRQTAAGGSASSFNVCVLGQDPFGQVLDAAAAGQVIDHAPVEVKRVASAQEAINCRIVYIGSSESEQLHTILAAIEKANVLTVSDMPKFAKHGGMIEFVLEGNRVRFEVNLSAVQRAGLNLSSELLKLATTVQREP